MTKTKWISVLLIALCVLILIGIGLMTYFLLDPMKDTTLIRLDLVSGFSQIVEFNDLAMVPGEKSEYRLLLSGEYEDDYSVSFSFREKEDRSLKQFAYVRIECGDEIICDKPLSLVFQEETYTCNLTLYKERATEVKVTYYIPENVGNEAQNAASKFELVVVADNSEAAYE